MILPPLHPPSDWFNPPSDIPTDRRVTVTDDGRVYGYVALWGACHIGFKGCEQPKRNAETDYATAHTGITLTAEGEEVRTANLGGGAGHAPDGIPADAAADFYENTSSQIARVRYGEDSNGIWFAGALWPDAAPLDVEKLRSTALSGDWRFMSLYRNTNTKGWVFAGSCLVNVGGFVVGESSSADMRGYSQMIAASIKQVAAQVFEASGGTSYIISEHQNAMEHNNVCDCNQNNTNTTQTANAVLTEEQMRSIADMVVTSLKASADAETETAEVDPAGGGDDAGMMKLDQIMTTVETISEKVDALFDTIWDIENRAITESVE